jgi:hypothetical protein
MSGNREDIRRGNLDSIFLMLILTLGLMISINVNKNNSANHKKSSATEISLNQSSATLCSGIPFPDLLKTLLQNNDSFRPLLFSLNQFLENKKTDHKISLSKNIWERSKRIPVLFSQYHLFPGEKEELPFLS